MATLRSVFLGSAVAAPAGTVEAVQSKRIDVVAATGTKKVSTTKKTTVKKTAAKKSVPKGDELSKWYGPERKLFLPVGLLDRAEVPAYLDGEVAGDYGYDPLGLGKRPQDFAKYQANELLHARWAMLGALGFILPELLNRFSPGLCGPEAVWWKTGALLLEGDSINYWGITIPANLFFATAAEIALVGGAEYFRSTNDSPLGSDLDTLYPGGYFDPLGLASDPEAFALLKVKEIKNGRLAMFSMLGFFIQAAVTGEGPVQNLADHLSDPFGNNLLTVLGNASERAPTL